MTETRAAICHEFNQPLTIEPMTLCTPNHNEVEVKLSACAICHSDITYMDGGWGGKLPAVYGHEGAGKITKIGQNVKNYKIGDHVIVTLIRSCAHCHKCTTGKPTHCITPDTRPARAHLQNKTAVHLAMSTGAFAEHVIVDQSQIARIPENMPMASAALISCGVLTGIGAAVESAKVRPGQSVIIIGIGGVGLNAIQGARIAGARRIIALDIIQEKLSIAHEFGATDSFLINQAELASHIHKITNGGADIAIVTVGAISAYETAPEYLCQGGKIIMAGMPNSNDIAKYKLVDMVSVAQSMVGTKMGDVVLARDVPWIIDLYQQGRLKIDELISKKWAFEHINEAIADTKTGHAKRNVIVF